MIRCSRCGFERADASTWCPNCGDGLCQRKPWLLVAAVAACLVAVAAFLLLGSGARAASFGMAGQKAGSQPVATGTLGAVAPTREGPFSVFSSRQRRPTVRIANHTEIPLRFVMRSADRRESSMEVPPNSENVLEADVGHYEAEILDPKGIIQSAVGDATFREFHEYRAEFWIGTGEDNGFHIGD